MKIEHLKPSISFSKNKLSKKVVKMPPERTFEFPLFNINWRLLVINLLEISKVNQFRYPLPPHFVLNKLTRKKLNTIINGKLFQIFFCFVWFCYFLVISTEGTWTDPLTGWSHSTQTCGSESIVGGKFCSSHRKDLARSKKKFPILLFSEVLTFLEKEQHWRRLILFQLQIVMLPFH